MATTMNRSLLTPYPGLRPFLLSESEIFFGRSQCVRELLDRLHSRRFVAVTGPSGCGKSSLIRAGLLPAILSISDTKDGGNWKVAIMRPGNNAFRNLAKALGDSCPDQSEGALLDIEKTVATLHCGPLSLTELLTANDFTKHGQFVLLVDQFEEIFRFADSENSEMARAFVELILTTATATDANASVVISMRSDFIGKCPIFAGLPEALNESQYLVPRLRADEIRDAVAGPARVFGANVEGAVIDKLVNEMGINPDQLPLMQHAMSRTWEFAQCRSNQKVVCMSLMDYEAIGGITSSLSLHADSVYEELADSERQIAEWMFRSMCEIGEYGELQRRLVTIAEVSKVSGASIEETVNVVHAYSRWGRNLVITSGFGELVPESLIDVTHEALLRNWARLRQWAQVERESAKQYKKIVESARHWQAGIGSLLEGHELELSLKWIESEQRTKAWTSRYGSDFALAMTYVTACRKAMAARQRSTSADEAPRTKIFISYRRVDEEHAAGRIYDQLREHFGGEEIFYDVVTIKPGMDFVTLIEARLNECAVLLAIIGSHWLEAKTDDGTRRLDDPGDWVRVEIETALTREIEVIPVLVGKSGMPSEDQLPVRLRPILRRQCHTVSSDRNFLAHVKQLIAVIESIVGPAKKRRRWLLSSLFGRPAE